jgi:NADPH:quinone reductase-like Zn-dependent oxidoreductase
MRAIVITRHGGPEVLQLQDRPTPEPKAGEVRIRVKASGINFADLMARVGLYPDAPPTPSVVGYEVSGVVEALGEGVTTLSVGDRVLAFTLFGGYAEQVVVPALGAVKMPEGMSFEVGAAIPVNYTTAYHMLHHVGSLKAGERVLVQSAAGGVGTAAIDLIFAAGAEPIGVASRSKHDWLRERGVNKLVAREEHFMMALQKVTNHQGVDIFLDSTSEDLRDYYATLAPGGRLIVFGASSMVEGPTRNPLTALKKLLTMPRFAPLKLMNDNRGVIGVNMNPFAQRAPEKLAAQMQALMVMYAEGKLHPHVDATFPPERAGEAHQYLHDRKNKGKVLIVWPE